MSELPILMSAPMVRAILEGRKTQTRRVAKVNSDGLKPGMVTPNAGYTPRSLAEHVSYCPYGKVGDLLWVRETHRKIIGQSGGWIETDYRATYKHGERLGDHFGFKPGWTPSIFMPRAASRITLRITGVRVERLNDISADDAAAEGWPGPDENNSIATAYPIAWYWRLWNQINGAGSWDLNPWVWALSFERALNAK